MSEAAVNDQQQEQGQDQATQDDAQQADLKDLFDKGDGDAGKDDEGAKDGDGAGKDDSAEEGRSGDDAPDSDSTTEGEAGDKQDGEGEPDKEAPTEEELTFKPESGYEKFAYEQDVTIDEQLEGSFKDFASTMNAGKGLSQKDAQTMIDFYQREVFGALDRARDVQRPISEKISKADPTYGGARYAQSTEDIEAFVTLCDNQAIADNYEGRQGLRELLEQTGLWWDARIRGALALAGEDLTREPSGPKGERRQGRKREIDTSTSRGLGEALFGDDEDDEDSS